MSSRSSIFLFLNYNPKCEQSQFTSNALHIEICYFSFTVTAYAKRPEITMLSATSDLFCLCYTVLYPDHILSGLSFPCFSWIILLLISKRSWIDGCYYFFMAHPDTSNCHYGQHFSGSVHLSGERYHVIREIPFNANVLIRINNHTLHKRFHYFRSQF